MENITITIKEMAFDLQVCRQTIVRYIKTNKLKIRSVGTLYSRKDFEDFKANFSK